jgi:hypothetical protein
MRQQKHSAYTLRMNKAFNKLRYSKYCKGDIFDERFQQQRNSAQVAQEGRHAENIEEQNATAKHFSPALLIVLK